MALAAAAVPNVQAQHQSAISKDPVAKAIEVLWTHAITALKAGNAAALAALYTPDAIILDPSAATVRGRAAIEQYDKNAVAAVTFVDLTYKTETFDRYGDIAVETGTEVETVQEKGKAPTEVELRYLLVYKNVKGAWLAYGDVTLPMPPAPPAK